MVLKLYGAPYSACTKRVAIVLKEKNVPFEFHLVDLAKGEQKAASHVEKQPFGKVPFIDDDGFILFESRAIARYIAVKYAEQGTPLIPQPSVDLKKTALFEQAASIELNVFDPSASAIAIEKVVNPLKGQDTNQAKVDEALANLEAKLDVYDKILSKQKYLAGEEITLADLFHIPWGALVKVAGYDIMESKPNVKRWWNDITSRPSYQAVKDGVA